MAILVLLDGENPGSTYEVTKDSTRIGRQTANDFVIPHNSVSSSHCTLERNENGFRIIDNDSTNGTKVNNIPVTSISAVYRGDVISLGDINMTLNGEDVPETPNKEMIDDIPRSTIVVRPVAPANIELSGGFSKKRDLRKVWTVLIVIVAIIVVGLLVVFAKKL